MRKKIVSLAAVLLLTGVMVHTQAQDAITYQTPPKVIADILEAKPTPSAFFDDNGQFMLLAERSAHPSIEDLAQPELRIAGMRINPNTFSASRGGYFTGFTIKSLASGKETVVKNLPATIKAGYPVWSPMQTKFAVTISTTGGADIYVVDVKTGVATKRNKTTVNTLLTNLFWEDENTLWYTGIVSPASAAPRRSLAPAGPIVQQNLGKTAPSRTYQDLIKNPQDEKIFEFYATSQLIKNTAGTEVKVGAPALYDNLSLSPDKKYLLVKKIDKPFSYLVPVSGFAATTVVMDKMGKTIKTLAKTPSRETAPVGFDNVQNVSSGFEWRDDVAATVCWRQPLDSGLYKNKMEFHDAYYALEAPFTGQPKLLFKTNYRLRGITWGNSTTALVTEGLQKEQVIKVSLYNPATGAIETLYERSTNDAYNNPGYPVTTKNKFGKQVLQLVNNGTGIMLTSTGASPKGDMPFLSIFDLKQKENKIIWRSDDPYYESVVKVIDADNKKFVTLKQSQNDVPNYFLHNLSANSTKAITSFTDPNPVLRKIKKQKIYYKRRDGIDLTATLYLPEGFDAGKDKPLPVLMWAYPREFKSAADAGQVRGSQNLFTNISYGSPVFFATQGFAVMDQTEFPIVGEGDKYPNDNFVEQLKWNAEAAIKKVAEMGVGDSTRVAVGGHSYGAFMTANLLAHTNLFKAGIARSGAYNRTLTPFGFQNEERTYWQAPEIYNAMSPFMNANKIKTPILMIHGEADDNPGTFPIQSERLYNAIKGHGGTARLVVLPYEAHGYAAKENLMHMLWEMNEWLNTYVKK